MTKPVIPDLRFEESLRARLVRNTILKQGLSCEDGEKPAKVAIPWSVLAQSLVVDQIIMPFLQSFLLTSALIYVRPLLRYFSNRGYQFGSSLIKSIKTFSKTIFFLNINTNMTTSSTGTAAATTV